MFKAMGPRGTLGPGPLGANWAQAPGNPWARAQRGQLGPGPKGPQYEPELVFDLNRYEPEPL